MPNLKQEYHIASWSWWKDSTYMIDQLLRTNQKLDEIVFCDTWYEFPQMYTYIEHMENYWNKKYPKLKITKLNYKTAIKIWNKRSESLWTKWQHLWQTRWFPFHLGMDWCTRELKIYPMKKYLKNYKDKKVYHYIGIAYNEPKRVRANWDIYPLINWKITENEITKILIQRWLHNPLYNHFTRTWCYLCPKQSINSLYKLYKHYPQQWQQIEYLQKRYIQLNATHWLFKGKTIDELKEKFKNIEESWWDSLDMREEEIWCFCK